MNDYYIIRLYILLLQWVGERFLYCEEGLLRGNNQEHTVGFTPQQGAS